MNLLEKVNNLRRQISNLDYALKEIAKDLENELGCSGYNRPTVRVIQEAVCDHFKLPLSMMRSGLRPDEIVRPRMIAMALACELTAFGSKELARCFDKKTHQSITYARDRVKAWRDIDPSFATTYLVLLATARSRIKAIDMPLFSKAS